MFRTAAAFESASRVALKVRACVGSLFTLCRHRLLTCSVAQYYTLACENELLHTFSSQPAWRRRRYASRAASTSPTTSVASYTPSTQCIGRTAPSFGGHFTESVAEAAAITLPCLFFCFIADDRTVSGYTRRQCTEVDETPHTQMEIPLSNDALLRAGCNCEPCSLRILCQIGWPNRRRLQPTGRKAQVGAVPTTQAHF